VIDQVSNRYFIAAGKIGNELIQFIVKLYFTLLFELEKGEFDEQLGDRGDHKLFVDRGSEVVYVGFDGVVFFQNNLIAESDEHVSVKLFLSGELFEILVYFDGGLIFGSKNFLREDAQLDRKKQDQQDGQSFHRDLERGKLRF
jgi:hypothetical protein